MSEEIKSLKNYISTTKNEIFTTFKIETISNLIIYYEDLQQKVEQLENIRKEAIEYINNEIFKRTILVGVGTKKYTRNILDNILNILNKGDSNVKD